MRGTILKRDNSWVVTLVPPGFPHEAMQIEQHLQQCASRIGKFKSDPNTFNLSVDGAGADQEIIS